MGATQITEKFTVNGATSEVIFDGVDFTLNGYIEVKNAKSVTLRNCRIYGLTTSAKSYWLKVLGNIDMKLTIENCFFGVNGSKMYNLIEPNAKLADGTSFSNNYLKAHSASHNSFCVYGVQDGAVININDNALECYTPGFRVGPKGDAACTIELKNNTVAGYLSELDGSCTDYFGLLCVQPYGTLTTSMSKMVINSEGNSMPENATSVVYGYSGTKDTLLDETTAPTLMEGDQKADMVIYH